jgi:hypothetical protein
VKNQLAQTKKISSKWKLVIWKIKMQARVQGMVKIEDLICFKWVQIGS